MAKLTKYLPFLLGTALLASAAVLESTATSTLSTYSSTITSSKSTSTASSGSKTGESPDGTSTEPDSPFASFVFAISMIVVSEIGDKTFLIAALMAMRHNRMIVFLGSISSLAIMTILAGIFGQAFTNLIPESIIHLAASILFFVFGYKILREGLAMSSGTGVQEEMEEVEEELAVQDLNSNYQMTERGETATNSKLRVVTGSKFQKFTQHVKANIMQYMNPVFVQVFVMVFLGEIGDRSQISTIIMASSGNYWYVIFGSIVGHALCSALAIIGGKMLATKISMKTVTLSGAVFFVIFGFIYFYEFITLS